MRLLIASALLAAFVSSEATAAVEVSEPASSPLITAPRPQYPEQARRDRIAGNGVAVLNVDRKSGAVTSAKMAQSTGSPLLDEAALSAFRRWRFKAGSPVAVVKVPVSFTLPSSSGPVVVTQPGGFGNVPDVAIESLYAATTPGGKTLAAHELKPLILSAPMPKQTLEMIGYLRLKIGVFLLTVADDGTVSNIEILQSTGHRRPDDEIIRALKRWRFRPGSVRQVRVPSYYTLRR